MSFFRKIFGKKKLCTDVEAEEAKKELFNPYIKETVLLKPHKSNVEISVLDSKFGGKANLTGFDRYPICKSCNTPLNFTLQLYKKDFPNHYFPPGKDIFQVFRCPNYECPDVFNEKHDFTIYTYYHKVEGLEPKDFEKPTRVKESEHDEEEVPDCYLKPIVKEDFPNHDEDFLYAEIAKFENKYGFEVLEKSHPKIGTKSGGHPSFQQGYNYPICNCGKTKEFFFQLSSEDLEDGVESPPHWTMWSAHGIMIGDLGNIYFYVCKLCGEKSIETNWDCG
jgi:hypothetical protein